MKDTTFCISFGKGYVSDINECKQCMLQNVERAKRCKNLTNQLIKDVCGSDEEVEKWLKEYKKIPKNISKVTEEKIEEEVIED
jgi:hypothetical protein